MSGAVCAAETRSWPARRRNVAPFAWMREELQCGNLVGQCMSLGSPSDAVSSLSLEGERDCAERAWRASA